MAVIVCVAANPASATDAAPSRAHVQAELAAARDSGELLAMSGEDSGSFWLARQTQRSSLTRQQVRTEFAEACGGGACSGLYGESSAWVVLANRPAAPGLRYAGPNIGAAKGRDEAAPAHTG
ncbi:MAG: hypothetical protein H7Z19_16665 [Chitinophagaceae bacterium]|nr:hypothetical protein [Rubrivivax sp.]